MERSFWENGLEFACTRCSACCRGQPGYVFLGLEDLDRLRSVFSQTREKFLESWCRTADFGEERLWSLKEKPNNDCVFWDAGCTVYDHRPTQCRTYPFWEHVISDRSSWEREGESCPGIGRGLRKSRDEIAECLIKRRMSPPLGPNSILGDGTEEKR